MTTTDDMILGIAAKLAETFPGVTIYTEKVPQNFTEPSFRIKRLEITSTPGLNTRKYKRVTFDLLYFPESRTEPETEWNGVAEALIFALEYINAGGGLLRGEDMSADFDAEQDVGHFRVAYGAFTLEHTTGDKMESITQKRG